MSELVGISVFYAGAILHHRFWCSDVLTGNQTRNMPDHFIRLFWCSDVLTGNQTGYGGDTPRMRFWCSDVLTGNQTSRMSALYVS